MKVLCLIPYQKGFAAGQRGSIELWEKVLRPVGIDLEFAPFETEELRRIIYSSGSQIRKSYEMIRGYVERIKLLRELDRFDAVFVYREAALLGPAFLEKYIARRKPIIYQLDDPLYVPYRSPSNGYLSYLKFFGKIKDIIAMSKVVMVNSSHIRSYAEQFNSNIWQVPSVVDTDQYVYRPFPDNLKRVTVGWSGSPTTAGNLKLVEEPLQRLSKTDSCDIHFIGGKDFGLREVNYTEQMWNGPTEVDDLRRLQIGLVPLPENAWNPHKFIMKTAQYMALGIVPVGTTMASNPEVIRHGENGFLADTDDEWERYLRLLVADSDLRGRLSVNAATDALNKYSLKANTGKVIEAFQAALG